MSRKEYFDKYIKTENGKPVVTDYQNVHERNIEGFESHILRFLPKSKNVSILDIGCGWGQLLFTLRQHGYENIKGIDLGYHQVNITRKRGIEAEQISDLQVYLETHIGKWDVIIMSQVIEHFSKDKMLTYLRTIMSALTDNGKLIISTPNMALYSGLVQRYTNFTHEIGFTERSLEQVLRVAGFSQINIYGEQLHFKPRFKYCIWLILRSLWFKLLGFIYLLEKGVDRPQIISRHLIAVAKRVPGDTH